MTRPISKEYYESTDAREIAKFLLGKIVVSTIENLKTVAIIVETEAYMAPDDLACHARGDRRTPRTETMFGAAGMSYVYRCYGIHHLFNVVTAPEGMAHAVLIRAVQPLEGMDIMQKRRKWSNTTPQLTNGPGKWTQAMGITDTLDGLDLTTTQSWIQIFDSDGLVRDDEIISGPRVGMSSLTRECGYYPWRYYIRENAWVSRPLVARYTW